MRYVDPWNVFLKVKDLPPSVLKRTRWKSAARLKVAVFDVTLIRSHTAGDSAFFLRDEVINPLVVPEGAVYTPEEFKMLCVNANTVAQCCSVGSICCNSPSDLGLSHGICLFGNGRHCCEIIAKQLALISREGQLRLCGPRIFW